MDVRPVMSQWLESRSFHQRRWDDPERDVLRGHALPDWPLMDSCGVKEAMRESRDG